MKQRVLFVVAMLWVAAFASGLYISALESIPDVPYYRYHIHDSYSESGTTSLSIHCDSARRLSATRVSYTVESDTFTVSADRYLYIDINQE